MWCSFEAQSHHKFLIPWFLQYFCPFLCNFPWDLGEEVLSKGIHWDWPLLFTVKCFPCPCSISNRMCPCSSLQNQHESFENQSRYVSCNLNNRKIIKQGGCEERALIHDLLMETKEDSVKTTTHRESTAAFTQGTCTVTPSIDY